MGTNTQLVHWVTTAEPAILLAGHARGHTAQTV